MEDTRLGNQYEDEATGFKGICVGVWISYGETQFSLAYMDGCVPKSAWVAEDRLKLISKKEKPGFT